MAAAELYRTLVETVLEATTPVPGEYERLVFFDPPEARRALREWLPGVPLPAQARGELGERLVDAFARAFGRGATRVAIVGSDAPGSRATRRFERSTRCVRRTWCWARPRTAAIT